MTTRNIVTEGLAAKPNNVNERFGGVYVVGGGASSEALNGVFGDGSTDDANALNTLANTTIDSDGGVIEFLEGEYVIGSSITLPKHVELRFRPDAVLTISSGVTLTLNGPISAPLKQIFDTSASSATVAFGEPTPETHPEWWGYVADGSTDGASEIQAAITAAGQGGVCVLSGDQAYAIASTLNITTNNTVLRGWGGKSNTSAGAKLRWVGSSGGTMLSGTSHGGVIERIKFECNDLANTAITWTENQSVRIDDVSIDDNLGWAVDLGSGSANFNSFNSKNLRINMANGGSGLRINASATENMRFDNLTIVPVAGATASQMISMEGTAHADFYDCVMSDTAMTGYAVSVDGGCTVGFYNWTTEVLQPISFTSATRNRASIFARVDHRSCGPAGGSYAMDLRGPVANEETAYILNGVRILTWASAAGDAPNINIQTATVHAAGVYWEDDSGGSPGAGDWNIAATGHLFTTDGAGKASVFRSANQTIGNASWTEISWDGESFDDLGFASTGTTRVTVPTDGKYRMTGWVWWAANDAGTRRMRLAKNGTGQNFYTVYTSPQTIASEPTTQEVNALQTLDAGDYMELSVRQSSGGGSLDVVRARFDIDLQGK